MKPTNPPTYYNRVVKEKRDRTTRTVVRRVRGTAGGDRIAQTDVPSTAASLTSLKCLLNKAVSEHALFATIDLTDFYLGAVLLDAEFIKISVNHYDTALLQSLNLLPIRPNRQKGHKICIFQNRQNNVRPPMPWGA